MRGLFDTDNFDHLCFIFEKGLFNNDNFNDVDFKLMLIVACFHIYYFFILMVNFDMYVC